MPHYTVEFEYEVQGEYFQQNATLFAGDEQIARHLFELRQPWARILSINEYVAGVDPVGKAFNGAGIYAGGPTVEDIAPSIKKPWLTSSRGSWMFLVALALAIFLTSTLVHRCNAQNIYLPPMKLEEPRFNWKAAGIMGGLGFVAGASDGLSQMFLFHKDDAENIFGDPKKWNPDETWRRKWKNGDKYQGEAFPLSSTLLVFTVDPYHGTRTATRWFSAGQYGVHGYFTFQEFRGWKMRSKRERRDIICLNLARVLFGEACRNIGFHATYTVLPTIYND